MSNETADDVRRSISLALGWGNTPPTDVLVKDIRSLKTALASVQKHLAILHLARHKGLPRCVDLDEAEKLAEHLARALHPECFR